MQMNLLKSLTVVTHFTFLVAWSKHKLSILIVVKEDCLIWVKSVCLDICV